MHGSVEDTKLSTNKQHTLSGADLHNGPVPLAFCLSVFRPRRDPAPRSTGAPAVLRLVLRPTPSKKPRHAAVNVSRQLASRRVPRRLFDFARQK